MTSLLTCAWLISILWLVLGLQSKIKICVPENILLQKSTVTHTSETIFHTDNNDNNNDDNNNNNNKELGHRISQRSGDDRKTQSIFQRLCVIIQRFNAVLFSENLLAVVDDRDM